ASLAPVTLRFSEATAMEAKSNKLPGQGVQVVVVDAAPDPATDYPHGLIVRTIIDGGDQSDPEVSVGIAPAATVTDQPFYNAPRGNEGDGKVAPSADNLATKLNGVADRAKKKQPTIVVVPVEVSRTKALTKALDRLFAAGVLVVAASGDRPGEGDFLEDFQGSVKPGEDAVNAIWPAADSRVVSVGVTQPGDLSETLRNSGVDLAAPGTGAVARGFNGGWCVVSSTSTHWATAQVAGVAALVWSAYPNASAKDLRHRLQSTASGNGGDASPLIGYGEVQPLAALDRSSDALGRKKNDEEKALRGKVPPERADLLAQTRDKAVWWGIGGGGALVVLLILRPVLSRRRSR
ncbi:MAG: S8 family serine peptidase, partial [Nocardioidaceae bacterium]|nr:S8 family serine peptidase [Nocardioidaceae bacterium]